MKNELLLKCCKTCKVEKTFDMFDNAKSCKDGKYKECKLCRKGKISLYSKKYYQKNIEKIKEYNYKWMRSPKRKEYNKKHYWENLEYHKNKSKKRQSTEQYKLYLQSEYYKTMSRNYRKLDNSKKSKRERDNKYSNELRDFYVKHQLKKQGFEKEYINKYPELLETKREIIKIKRLCKI